LATDLATAQKWCELGGFAPELNPVKAPRIISAYIGVTPVIAYSICHGHFLRFVERTAFKNFVELYHT